MSYEKSIDFEGNIDKALEIARNTLIPHGFTIVTSTNESIELDGPSTFWAKGQNPLFGVSKIYVSGGNNEVAIKADLGGIRKAIKFLIIFFVGMSVFLLLLFGILFYKQDASGYRYLLPLAPFIPWPVLIPLMSVWMKSRTVKSLDSILNNMAVSG